MDILLRKTDKIIYRSLWEIPTFWQKSYWQIVTGLALQFIGEKWLSFLVSKKIDFIIRMSKTCYKKPISESLGFVYSKLEKMALKAKKTKKSVLKQFQIKGNTYSVVIIKNDKDDPLEPLMYFISTLQNKTEILDGYRIRWQVEICFKHLKSNAAPLGAST